MNIRDEAVELLKDKKIEDAAYKLAYLVAIKSKPDVNIVKIVTHIFDLLNNERINKNNQDNMKILLMLLLFMSACVATGGKPLVKAQLAETIKAADEINAIKAKVDKMENTAIKMEKSQLNFRNEMKNEIKTAIQTAVEASLESNIDSEISAKGQIGVGNKNIEKKTETNQDFSAGGNIQQVTGDPGLSKNLIWAGVIVSVVFFIGFIIVIYAVVSKKKIENRVKKYRELTLLKKGTNESISKAEIDECEEV
jgi:uncharacterized membrane protein